MAETKAKEKATVADSPSPKAAGASAPATPALSTGALATLGLALSKMASQQAIAERGFDTKIDETVPGGRYQGVDGHIHDAHGNVYDKDGENIVSSPMVNTLGSIASAQTPEELDAMVKAIESRKAQLEEQAKAIEAGTQRAAAEGASKTKSQDANLPGEDEIDYSSWSRDKLEKEVARRGITGVKGTGTNGTIVKADFVKALDRHQASLAGQPGPTNTNVAL